ncbi:MAG: hypothetical protein WC438_00330 [Candidatus Pacearchaeota archaeon]
MEILKELNKLNLPKNQFAVFGSGPLTIRGIRENKDIDIIVKKDLWDKLIKKYQIIDFKKIDIENIEIYKDWKPWFNDVDKLIDDADIFNGIRFVKLKYVLKWKEEFGREKDKKDIKLIKKYLENGIKEDI